MDIIRWLIRFFVMGFLSITTTLAIAFFQFLTHSVTHKDLWEEVGFPFTIYRETSNGELRSSNPFPAMVNSMIFFVFYLLIYLLFRKFIQPKLTGKLQERESNMIDG